MKCLLFLSLACVFAKPLLADKKPNEKMVELHLPPNDEPEQDLSGIRQEFSVEFLKATTPEMMRNLCLDAMDSGLLSIGTTEAQVKQMFGLNSGGGGRIRYQEVGKRSFVIHFHGRIVRRKPENRTGAKESLGPEEYLIPVYGGSYLFIQYDNSETIKKYYISNSWAVLKGFDQ